MIAMTEAAAHLFKELSTEYLHQLKTEIETNPNFQVEQQFGIGLQIRNLLRRGGFDWDDVVMDEQWFNVLQEAVRREEAS